MAELANNMKGSLENVLRGLKNKDCDLIDRGDLCVGDFDHSASCYIFGFFDDLESDRWLGDYFNISLHAFGVRVFDLSDGVIIFDGVSHGGEHLLDSFDLNARHRL